MEGFEQRAFDAMPETDPVTPGDLISTIYSLVGIDSRQMIYDNLQRPHPIVADSRVLSELLAWGRTTTSGYRSIR